MNPSKPPSDHSDLPDLSMAVATCNSPVGAAYRGKIGCRDLMCTQDGNPERCYGWHCLYCDGRLNCQGDCSNCAGRHGLVESDEQQACICDPADEVYPRPDCPGCEPVAPRESQLGRKDA